MIRDANGETWVRTVCHMCYNMCTIQVRRERGVAVNITGVRDAPPNHGKVCAKGRAQIQSLYSPYRIKRPLLRTNPRKGLHDDPGWREISWAEAMDLMTERLASVWQNDPRKLMLLAWDNPSSVTLRSFASGFGTRNTSYGSAGFFCGNATHPVTYWMMGSMDMFMDLDRMDLCILFGSQFGFGTQAHAMAVAVKMADARQRGMKVIVIDPHCSNAAAKADEWIPIRPATDAALALGMVHLLLNDLGLYDADYLRRYTNATYLVGEDECYVRDPVSGTPLVWNARADRAEPYDTCPPDAAAIEGEHRVGGVPCSPALGIFRRHVAKYTPERVESITTVPAATVRRLAEMFGRAARIGSTVVIDGHSLPHRPAVAWWYRGVSQHKHSLLNGFAMALLNLVVGNVDVPGGLLNVNGAGPFGLPGPGEDGLITKVNRYSQMRSNWPLPPVTRPETVELIELFPVATYTQAVPWLGILEPEKFKLPYLPEVLIQCRTNVVSTAADPERMAEALARIPFQISFADFPNETAWLADLVLPDAHSFERLVPFGVDPFVTHLTPALPGEDWCFVFQQPVVEPQGEARYWVQVLWELADRIGCLPDVYAAFNVLAMLEQPYQLEFDHKYTWEEICDRWARSRCGVGLEYFKEHGYFRLGKRTVQESYPRVFHTGRIPIYQEHFKRARDEVAGVVAELGIPWELDDYHPLIDWKPCPAYHLDDGSLYLVNIRVPLYTHSMSAENPMLRDLCERGTYTYQVGINVKTARQLGIGEGDRIVLETHTGRQAEGVATLREGLHPEVVTCAGVTGRWVTGDPRVRGKGIHYNSLLTYTPEMLDYLSAALDACVRVKVRKIEGSH